MGVFWGDSYRSLPQVRHRREMDQMEFDLLVFGIVSECIGGICDLVVYLAANETSHGFNRDDTESLRCKVVMLFGQIITARL